MKILPESRLGKWAAVMTWIYVILIVIVFLCMAIWLVVFDMGHWWDITVGITVPIAFIAFILSILAIRKERTILTCCTLVLGILAVRFRLSHSLNIYG